MKISRICGRCGNHKNLHLPYARGQVIVAVPSFLAKPPCHNYTRRK